MLETWKLWWKSSGKVERQSKLSTELVDLGPQVVSCLILAGLFHAAGLPGDLPWNPTKPTKRPSAQGHECPPCLRHLVDGRWNCIRGRPLPQCAQKILVSSGSNTIGIAWYSWYNLQLRVLRSRAAYIGISSVTCQASSLALWQCCLRRGPSRLSRLSH